MRVQPTAPTARTSKMTPTPQLTLVSAGAIGGTPISSLLMFNNRFDPELVRQLGRDAQDAVRSVVQELEAYMWRLREGDNAPAPFDCAGKTVDLPHGGRCGVLLFLTNEEVARRKKLRQLRAHLESTGDSRAVELLDAVEAART